MISVKITFSCLLIACFFYGYSIADEESNNAGVNIYDLNSDDTDPYLPSRKQDSADVENVESEIDSSTTDSSEKQNEIRLSDEKAEIVDGVENKKPDKKKYKNLFRESSETEDIVRPRKGKSEKHKLEKESVKGDKPKKSKKNKETVHFEEDNDTYQFDSSKENEEQGFEIESTSKDETDAERKAKTSEEVTRKWHPKFPPAPEGVESTENGFVGEKDTKNNIHPNSVPENDQKKIDRVEENKVTKAKTTKLPKIDKFENKKSNRKEMQSNEEQDAQDHTNSDEEKARNDVVVVASSSSVMRSFLIVFASLTCLPLLAWWSPYL